MFPRRGAVAAALLALCAVAPTAVAHEGNPNYRSEVRAIEPAVPGLDARVLNFDDRIEFVYTGDSDLIVEGYRGEPYLRFRASGRVELNRRSPAGYLNEDRFAQVEVPASADRRAQPDWRMIAENGRYDWHDHRIHWMSEGTQPSRITDESERTKIFDWRLPIEAGGRPATVSGTLVWVGRDEGGFPIAAALSLAAAGIAGALLIVFVRRRRSRPGARKEAW